MDSETPLVPDPAPASGGADSEPGWVTARPPRAVDVVRRIVCFPWLCLGHRDLIFSSVRRDLQARFTGTVLGWLWPLIQPLLLFAVYYFIFSKLLGFKFAGHLPEGQEAAFGIFMFVGVIAWAAFAESLTRGCACIVDNGTLIKKLAFPSEILPLNVVIVGLVTTLFAVAMFIAATVATPVWMAPGTMLVWLPLLVLLQGMFTYGMVLFLSAVQVFIRDTLQLVTVLATVWMFLTPIFWTPELVGESIDPYLWLVEGNPMFHILYAWRVVLMSSQPELAFQGDFNHSLTVFTAWAVGSFVVGYGFFVLCQRRFADEV